MRAVTHHFAELIVQPACNVRWTRKWLQHDIWAGVFIFAFVSLLLMSTAPVFAVGLKAQWGNRFYPNNDGLHASWQSAFQAEGDIVAYNISQEVQPPCTREVTFEGYELYTLNPIQYDPYSHQPISISGAHCRWKDVYSCPDATNTSTINYWGAPTCSVGVETYIHQCWDNTTQANSADCPAVPACGTGEIPDTGTHLCKSITKDKKLFGDCHACESPNSPKVAVKDPVNIAIGNLYEKQMDYSGNGLSGIRFVRSYNSGDDTVSELGPGWLHNYDRHIDLSADGTLATFTHGDGRVANYRPFIDNSWITDTDEVGTLTRTMTGWTFQLGNAVETYDSNGRLLSLTNEAGYTQTLTYTNGNLTRVDGIAGAFLTFSYSGEENRTPIV